MRANDDNGAASKRALERQVNPINVLGVKLYIAILLWRALCEKRDEFVERHKAILSATADDWIGYLLYFAGLLFVWAIDFWMLGGAIEYWVGLMTQTRWLIDFLKYFIPACVVMIETVVSVLMHRARQLTNEYETNVTYYFWMTVGGALAVTVPLIAVYTAAAVKAATGESSSFLMVIVLAVLSFAGHALVLWGGDFARNAETWAAAQLRNMKKESDADRQGDLVARLTRKFQTRAVTYIQHWESHVEKYGWVKPGPFDARVWELLKKFFPQLDLRDDDPSSPLQK